MTETSRKSIFLATGWKEGPSRYWPRQGFLPIAYRLSRFIDPRIAWAIG